MYYVTKDQRTPHCLKITQNVAFNIASEASYGYILSGQKLIKNAKNGQFWRLFENFKLAVKLRKIAEKLKNIAEKLNNIAKKLRNIAKN